MADKILSIISAAVGFLEAIAVFAWAATAIPVLHNGLEYIGSVVLTVAVIFQFVNLLREIVNE